MYQDVRATGQGDDLLGRTAGQDDQAVAEFAESVAVAVANLGRATDEDAAGVVARKCQTFKGTDDNRSACTDWCSTYLASNAGNTCACDDGACPDAVPAPQAAAAPATVQ